MFLEKKVSTTRGVIIIIAFAAFALGAIFGYEYYLTKNNPVLIELR